MGWPGPDAKMHGYQVESWGSLPLRNNRFPGHKFEGTMSAPFYEPFFSKFVGYSSPRLREVDVWLWIVEDRKSEQVYDIVRKLQPEYAVSKSHYVATPVEGAYITMKDSKTNIVNVLCLYFVYKAELLKTPNHPIGRMDRFFQVSEGLGTSRSFYDEAKYANYPMDELRMEFYLRMMRTLTKRGDFIFNIFGGSKPIYAAMVRFQFQCFKWLVWVD
jgi:hypothetical protein